jgi:hypothetical protein
MTMPVSEYEDYIRPFYARFNAVNGNIPADFSKAAFLAFIAEFPELPLSAANVEFLKRCFENHFKQN